MTRPEDKGRTPAPICPVCDFRSCSEFMTHEGIELFSCADCGTVFMHPLPTTEDVTGLYADSYDGATSGYFAKVDKKMRRSRRRMCYEAPIL